jgi:hypothetical protein
MNQQQIGNAHRHETRKDNVRSGGRKTRGDRSGRRRQNVLLKTRRKLEIGRRGISPRRNFAIPISKKTTTKTIVHDHQRRDRIDIRWRKRSGCGKRRVEWNVNALKPFELLSAMKPFELRLSGTLLVMLRLSKEACLQNGTPTRSMLGNTCKLRAEKLHQIMISLPILACPRDQRPLLAHHLPTKSDMPLQHNNSVMTIHQNVRLREGKRGGLQTQYPHEVAKSRQGDHQLCIREIPTLTLLNHPLPLL